MVSQLISSSLSLAVGEQRIRRGNRYRVRPFARPGTEQLMDEQLVCRFA
jgi:hypothetical protein